MNPTSDAEKMQQTLVEVDSNLQQGAGRAPTILLVEDDRDLREITATLLEHHGFRVLDVGNGREALSTLRSGCVVDAMLLDFELPGMNGLSVADAARAIRPGLPALFVTGYGVAAERRGVPLDQIVPKPFRDDDLARRLKDLIGIEATPVRPSMVDTMLVPRPCNDDIRLVVAYG